MDQNELAPQPEIAQSLVKINQSGVRQTPVVSVVLPIYQEETSIEALIVDLVETLQVEGFSFEILAVDDGSRDDTLSVLKSIQKKYPQYLRIAHHVINKGNGAAVRTGIRLARGEIVVCMDADGQHSPKDIPALLAHIPPYDMVVGARTESYKSSWYRNIGNRFYNWFSSWLTQSQILDLTSGFRALRRAAALHFLPLYPSGFSSPTTSTMTFLKAGYNVKFIPIHVLPRTKGKSKINLWKDGSRFIIIILRIVMLYDPLRIFLPISGVLLLLGTLTMVVGIFAAARLVVPGSSVVLFIAALLTLLLGLVSSQIATSYIHYFGDELVTVYEPHVEST